MKFILCLAVAFVVLAVGCGEPCSKEDECKHVTCDSATTLACSHSECTCLEPPSSNNACPQTACKGRDDCDSCGCRNDVRPNRIHHCFDAKCTCGFGSLFPGGPIGK